ncbi:MAG: superoxide dismutase family protein [Nitrospirae bacterium]|nr:superoxide dismutase family protein [Candidatus Manganitrophaceae bacterium]
MNHIALIASGLLLWVGVASAENVSKGEADLQNGQGEKIGTATFTEGSDGVKIAIEASKLAPGQHGVHIHAAGKCEGPDFKTAGGHLNPEGKKHGLQSSEGPHAGDLPNLTVGPDGTVKTEVTTKRVTFNEGKNSLLQTEGTALVIHVAPDDEKSDPIGNAGPRVACGMIKKK